MTNAVTLSLLFRPPFTAAPMLGALAAHAVDGLERHDSDTRAHTRVVPAPHGPAVVTVEFDAPEHVSATVLPGAPGQRPAHRIADAPLAGPRRRPGRDRRGTLRGFGARRSHRRPSGPARARLRRRLRDRRADGARGQQVSLSAARTFASCFVMVFGTATAFDEFVSFPEPDELAGPTCSSSRKRWASPAPAPAPCRRWPPRRPTDSRASSGVAPPVPHPTARGARHRAVDRRLPRRRVSSATATPIRPAIWRRAARWG